MAFDPGAHARHQAAAPSAGGGDVAPAVARTGAHATSIAASSGVVAAQPARDVSGSSFVILGRYAVVEYVVRHALQVLKYRCDDEMHSYPGSAQESMQEKVT